MTPTTQPAEHTKARTVSERIQNIMTWCRDAGPLDISDYAYRLTDSEEYKAFMAERAAPESAIEQAREALRDAVIQIEYLHAKFVPTGTGNATIARINHALSALTPATDKQG